MKLPEPYEDVSIAGLQKTIALPPAQGKRATDSLMGVLADHHRAESANYKVELSWPTE